MPDIPFNCVQLNPIPVGKSKRSSFTNFIFQHSMLDLASRVHTCMQKCVNIYLLESHWV